jgi:peptide deformylase
MTLLKVARLGNPVLRQKTRLLTVEELRSPRLQQLIDDMVETMREDEGVGLAAPQVHESISLLVLEVQGGPRSKTESIPLMILANVKLSKGSRDTETDWEGCLSIPGLRGKVARHKSIEVHALDRTGAPVAFKANGFLARVIQHEADHLDGIVFLDRMADLSSLSFLEEFTRYGIHEPA